MREDIEYVLKQLAVIRASTAKAKILSMCVDNAERRLQRMLIELNIVASNQRREEQCALDKEFGPLDIVGVMKRILVYTVQIDDLEPGKVEGTSLANICNQCRGMGGRIRIWGTVRLAAHRHEVWR